jgi:hypothetical protein
MRGWLTRVLLFISLLKKGSARFFFCVVMLIRWCVQKCWEAMLFYVLYCHVPWARVGFVLFVLVSGCPCVAFVRFGAIGLVRIWLTVLFVLSRIHLFFLFMVIYQNILQLLLPEASCFYGKACVHYCWRQSWRPMISRTTTDAEVLLTAMRQVIRSSMFFLDVFHECIFDVCCERSTFAWFVCKAAVEHYRFGYQDLLCVWLPLSLSVSFNASIVTRRKQQSAASSCALWSCYSVFSIRFTVAAVVVGNTPKYRIQGKA